MIEGILQSLSVSPDKKYCISYSNNDQIVSCNIISGDVRVLNRQLISTPPPPPPALPPLARGNQGRAAGAGNNNTNNRANPGAKPRANPPPPAGAAAAAANHAANTNNATNATNNHNNTTNKSNSNNNNNNNNKTDEAVSAAAAAAALAKEKSDSFIGSHAGTFYFVVWSKYYWYVYDKKGRMVRAEKSPCPIIQLQVIDNESVKGYGTELEMITRAEDCSDDEEKERDYLILDYKFILDPARVPTKKATSKNETSTEDLGSSHIKGEAE